MNDADRPQATGGDPDGEVSLSTAIDDAIERHDPDVGVFIGYSGDEPFYVFASDSTFPHEGYLHMLGFFLADVADRVGSSTTSVAHEAVKIARRHIGSTQTVGEKRRRRNGGRP